MDFSGGIGNDKITTIYGMPTNFADITLSKLLAGTIIYKANLYFKSQSKRRILIHLKFKNSTTVLKSENAENPVLLTFKIVCKFNRFS